MYADEVGAGGGGGGVGWAKVETAAEGVSGNEPPLPHHWYDEPPYESDPEDFLVPLADLSR